MTRNVSAKMSQICLRLLRNILSYFVHKRASLVFRSKDLLTKLNECSSKYQYRYWPCIAIRSGSADKPSVHGPAGEPRGAFSS